MYENERVWEPTGPGHWWRSTGPHTDPYIVRVFRRTESGLMWSVSGGGSHRVCRKEGIRWTGPIPVPENTLLRDELGTAPFAPEEDPCASCDHTNEDGNPTCGHRPCGPPNPKGCSDWRERPAPSEDAPPGVEWPPPGLETGGLNPPTPSEDEGSADEFLEVMSDGELLKMLIEECPGYDDVYGRAAAKFREEIERGMAPKDKPRPSDEELGRIVLTVLRNIHHTLDEEYYTDRTYREVGRLLRVNVEV